ncbi:hypothetical protein Tco_1491070 [Tanacetum coccineum]
MASTFGSKSKFFMTMETPSQDELLTNRTVTIQVQSRFQIATRRDDQKTDIVLKAITDRIAGALPSDTVKNPKLSTSLVLSARSYPTIDPQCSSYPSTSINAIKAHSKEANISQTSLLRPGMETQQLEELKPTLEDEFQDLHLNLSVLEVLAHVLIYNVILDKYVKILEPGKNRSAFVQREVTAKMEDPGLFTLPCRLGDSKPLDTFFGIKRLHDDLEVTSAKICVTVAKQNARVKLVLQVKIEENILSGYYCLYTVIVAGV